MLEIGMKAPEFTLPDKNGKQVSLSDYKGKKVVLYFYPKDNTPGCTRQACAFADLLRKRRRNNRHKPGQRRFPRKVCGKVQSAVHPSLGYGTFHRRNLRGMAGKEALRKGQHGRCTNNVYYRRKRKYFPYHEKSKTRYKCGRCSGRALKVKSIFIHNFDLR